MKASAPNDCLGLILTKDQKSISINSYQLATHCCKMQVAKNIQASMKKMFNYMLVDLLRDVTY